MLNILFNFLMENFKYIKKEISKMNLIFHHQPSTVINSCPILFTYTANFPPQLECVKILI